MSVEKLSTVIDEFAPLMPAQTLAAWRELDLIIRTSKYPDRDERSAIATLRTLVRDHFLAEAHARANAQPKLT